MNCRFATFEDIAILTSMNEQLIADEGHRNPMNREQLAERMSGWLKTEYQAVLFLEGQTKVGYTLFRRETGYVYIRQFFVLAEYRRKRIGQNAIQWLRKNAWPNALRLRIEVLVDNVVGREFWRSVGFVDYCITMEVQL